MKAWQLYFFSFILIASNAAFAKDILSLNIESGYGYDYDDNLVISADQKQLLVGASLNFPKELTAEKMAEYSIEWKTNHGTFISSNTVVDEYGESQAILLLPSQAGGTINISAKLKGPKYKDKSKLEPVLVIPGEPSSIEIANDGTVLLVDGLNQATYTFTVKDQFGNLASNRSLLWFHLIGSLTTVDRDDELLNGQASITVSGSAFPELSYIEFKSNDVEVVTEVDVVSLGLNWNAPSTIQQGSTLKISVKATDLQSNAIEGVTLWLSVNNGKIAKPFLKTNKDGIAVIDFTAPSVAGITELSLVGGGSVLEAEIIVE